jgi:poly(3-hydroxybutyrate) depolymerase
MLYQAYQAHADMMAPWRAFAGLAATSLGEWLNGAARSSVLSNLTAAYELIARAGLSHVRPPYGIETVAVGHEEEVAVTEEVADVTPFGTLLHFRKDVTQAQPRVLVVARLSGHFATLLRATARTLLTEHDVYITDWRNARDVPLEAGAFGFDDYITHLIRWMEKLGPGAHMVAVCQPCVAGLVAASVMAQGNNPAQPLSLTLMAGPIDTRVNPTKVNELAKTHDIGWSERNLIGRVPHRYAGGGRQVYPGFVQLTAFMSMNIDRHLKAHRQLYENIAKGDTAKAAMTKAFYDEYFAVLDLTAEFYLEIVQWVFQDHKLPLGELTYQGQKVEPAALKRTTLLTVEGERDDICAVGQTLAAHDLCTSLRPYRKRHHMQAGVGHYGVFSGKAWQNQIYPILKNVILQSD